MEEQKTSGAYYSEVEVECGMYTTILFMVPKGIFKLNFQIKILPITSSFLSPLESAKCVMVASALWNFVLKYEGPDQHHENEDGDLEAPVIGPFLPQHIPPNHADRIPTRDRIKNLYWPQYN